MPALPVLQEQFSPRASEDVNRLSVTFLDVGSAFAPMLKLSATTNAISPKPSVIATFLIVFFIACY